MQFFPNPGSISTSSAFITHRSLHLRDAHDAHVLLEAVRQNLLPLVKRRLATHERDQLASGNVYVWEESQDDGLLVRWTDGRKWSQSRMRGDYLFYEEKVDVTQAERQEKAARRQRRASDPTAVAHTTTTRRKDRPSKPNGLTKQTYSVSVHLSQAGTQTPRKWHVVAYFSGEDYMRLPVVENYDFLKNIRVPEGVFISSKASVRMDRVSYSPDDESRNRLSSQHQSDDEESLYRDAGSSSYFSSLASGSVTASASSSPTVSSDIRHQLPPRRSLTASPLASVILPSTSTLRPMLPPRRNSSAATFGNATTVRRQYAPLSAEDRRALDKLKVVL